MESRTGKESVVSRLFGFGRKKQPVEETERDAATGAEGAETGFARTADADQELEAHVEAVSADGSAEGEDGPSVTIPEQVIRIRTRPVKKKEEVIGIIGESFKELTSMLGSVSDRLDRQDVRSADLSEQLTELPEYLRTLPRLQQEQNEALREQNTAMREQNAAVRDLGVRVAEGAERVAGALQRIPESQEQQARAISSLGDRVAEGTEAVHGVADVIAKIPEEIRERANVQEEAIREAATAQTDAMREVASAQQNMAKAVYQGQQKSLQVFQNATKQTITNLQKQAKSQEAQMRSVLDASVQNMRRMFVMAAVFMGITIAAVVAVALF